LTALPGDRALVMGMAVTGQAMAAALARRGVDVVAVDDHPSASVREASAAIGVTLVEAPDPTHLQALVAAADMVLPSPGVPDHHVVFTLAGEEAVPVVSEFDLADAWDDRPLVAITGTDGKTTVTTMVTEVLNRGGRYAVAAGNTETPLVTAIDDPDVDVFVVEASSFRLAHTRTFRPCAATWLNFAPDHQDAHRSLGAYEDAKARIWADQRGDGDVAIGNADDAVVARRLRDAPARHVSFGLGAADWSVRDGELSGPGGDVVVARDDLWRALPHDVSNALAVCATVLESPPSVAVDVAAVGAVLRTFAGLHHRVELVGESGGVRWYDDSKATAPHATLSAVVAFDSVVLVAGGRNKGLDLGVLAEAAPHVRAVVAIGEAAGEIEATFRGVRPVVTATSMDDAVDRAGALALEGDVVLLSPACASFDWYANYGERGDDFVRAVQARTHGVGPR
jgi:UDP-N-acetylmuramoylalanine--D-glutamate ligase